MEQNWLKGPVPMALGMALVENPQAMEKYAALSRSEKQQLIDGSKKMENQRAMQAYVEQFVTG